MPHENSMKYILPQCYTLSYCVNTSSQSCILVPFIESQNYKEFVT